MQFFQQFQLINRRLLGHPVKHLVEQFRTLVSITDAFRIRDLIMLKT
jgi:hypothetical protein